MEGMNPFKAADRENETNENRLKLLGLEGACGIISLNCFIQEGNQV